MRTLLKGLGIALACLFLFIGSIHAASSMDDHSNRYLDLPGDVDIWAISWIAHTNGAFTTATTRWAVDGYVFMVIINPGATAPDAGYDITLLDSDGMDIMGGQLTDLSTSVTAQFIPKIGSVYGTRFVRGPLTVTIGDNTANGAIGEIIIYIWGGE